MITAYAERASSGFGLAPDQVGAGSSSSTTRLTRLRLSTTRSPSWLIVRRPSRAADELEEHVVPREREAGAGAEPTVELGNERGVDLEQGAPRLGRGLLLAAVAMAAL